MKLTFRIAALWCLAVFGASSTYAVPVITTLVNFNNTNGQGPDSSLIIDAAENLYGTTTYGGSNSAGTVFKISAGGHTLTTLASFKFTAGYYPHGSPLIDVSGNLYGATSSSPSLGGGTVYKLTVGTNALTTLATFNNTNGTYPTSNLIADSSGNLYGTTNQGGANGNGTVFKVAAGTNALTTLVNFNVNTVGAYPEDAGVIFDTAGNLYGTTAGGGAFGKGTVYKIAAGTNRYTTIASFDGTNGNAPYCGVIMDAAGNMYGTTQQGGSANYGTVFKIAAGTNTITTLASFNATGDIGYFPRSPLLMDANGNLFGTTIYGGGNGGSGTVFKIAAGTNSLSTLVSLSSAINGSNPTSGLVADSQGNLYGTAYGGGANGYGTVFEITGTGYVVPEPSSLTLVGIGCFALLTRNTRRLTSTAQLQCDKIETGKLD